MTYLPQPSNIFYPYTYNPGIQTCFDPLACKLKVQGEGSIMVQPDIAVVVLGISTENKELKLAQEENTIKSNAVLKTLKDMSIQTKDIQTQSYTITPQYDYIDGKQVIRSYLVVNNLEITIRDMSKIGEIIDAAVESGANQVNSIRFSVSDQSKYYRQALKSAVDDAILKSRTLGNTLKSPCHQYLSE